MVIFTSDHAAYDKGHCYTGGSRIPLLLRWPAMLLARSTPLPHLVSHLDLLPTILQAADVPLGEPTEAEGLSHRLGGQSLAALLVGVSAPTSVAAAGARVEGANDVSVYEGGWAHGTSHERILFCEIGSSRAVFTTRYRLIYSPRIKPIAKGGTTDVRRNYQANKHHAAYWRPLQLYDLLADASEQRNLINPTDRAASNMSHADEQSLMLQLARLQELLSVHLGAKRAASECVLAPDDNEVVASYSE
jgi:arylsulfatase A-like enzyme